MTRDCWQDFALSGKISDYLQYRKQKEGLEILTGSFVPDAVAKCKKHALSGSISEEKEEKWDKRFL